MPPKRPASPAFPVKPPVLTTEALDRILAVQLFVAWAGEGRCEPKRLGWWETDLIDDAGGGDLLARLAPRTHAWASLELVREAARRVDARARGQRGDSDTIRTLYFLGFELDERLGDRLGELKREGTAPEKALPLPCAFAADFDRDAAIEILSKGGGVRFEKTPPVGRRLQEPRPLSAVTMVEKLAAALVPFADEYPLPFFAAED